MADVGDFAAVLAILIMLVLIPLAVAIGFMLWLGPTTVLEKLATTVGGFIAFCIIFCIDLCILMVMAD